MSNIIKTFILIICLTFSELGYAVCAYPGLIKVVQPDGRNLSIKKIGDENGYILLTSDNLPITYTSSGSYEYTLKNASAIEASGVWASNPEERKNEEIKWIKDNKKFMNISLMQKILLETHRVVHPE